MKNAILRHVFMQYKYHSLIDKVCSQSNLQAAFRQGARRNGNPGLDNITWVSYAKDLENNLMKLEQQLKNGEFVFSFPQSLDIIAFQQKSLRIYVWNVEERIVQHALKRVLTPIYEKFFSDIVFGYRPGRGTAQAYKAASKLLQKYNWVLSADIEKFSISVNQELLKQLILNRIADGKVIDLIEHAVFPSNVVGLPPGNVLYPLMSDIYLNECDQILCKLNVLRFCDNIIVFDQTEPGILEAHEIIVEVIAGVGLKLNEAKTKIFCSPSPKNIFQ